MTVNCDRDCICMSCSGYPVYSQNRAQMSALRSMLGGRQTESSSSTPLSTEHERTAAPMDQNTQPAHEPATPAEPRELTAYDYFAHDAAAAERAQYAIYFGQNPAALGEHNPWM